MLEYQPAATPVQAGKGSATLSMAYAAAEFGHSCLRALAGDANIIECAYVESHLTELSFFASPVRLGPEGVQVGFVFSTTFFPATPDFYSAVS